MFSTFSDFPSGSSNMQELSSWTSNKTVENIMVISGFKCQVILVRTPHSYVLVDLVEPLAIVVDF